MKKILLLGFILFIANFLLNIQTQCVGKDMPEGIFKKQRNGNFVQYDKKGKKIGTYKLKQGRLVLIK